jgi:tetratricopeptide (TPR) repeat protein
MRLSFRFLSLLALISSAIVLMQPGDSLAGTCEKAVARMVSAQGIVQVKRVGETQWQQVKLNETYCPGDVIQVGERSRADVALSNQPVLRLDQNTVITLGGLKEERTSLISLIKGAAHFFSRVTRGLEVQTAFVNAGVEGTEFFIRVEEDKTFLSVFEGKVLAWNPEGSLAITGGQSAVAEAGKAPVVRVVVHPRDAVQWALYYPPVVYEHPTELKENDPRFYTSRASSLLQVGRVDEAKADLGKALELDPNNSVALALQSIIAVTQNEKEKALDLAGKAVQSNPNSAEAHIALSYAQQADFNLEGALNSVKEAVRVQPENALAWARLAELQLSFGRLNEALDAARKAVTLNPDISRTQTVLGFAFLSEVNTGEAKKAFEKAIELDQADPLPRLGLGLSKIREGELDEGGRDIEIAASLDPNNSLIRSYLGKTFFEEKRSRKASEEYGIAKELDPADPTPYFYDAILKQTTNRPVEALHDMEKAIELNDNRAVYRSQLLLDSDLAARSASLGRVYSDLGFQQLALVEGWKSENTDPSNFSAHRFLADSYSALPRHEIARVSELLQSQLLQPINITPIQPQLAESNLFLISSSGSGALSFNEFNPIFNRNGLNLQVSGLVGGNDTVAGETVVAGIYKKLSFSAGYTHFKTDGWRTNAFQDDAIANVFAQVEVSPQTSVQTEFRHRDNKRGDVEELFWRDNVAPNDFLNERSESIRLGFHHSFSPSSELIGNFMYSDKVSKSLNLLLYDPQISLDPNAPPPPPYLEDFFNADIKEKARSAELQHLFRWKYVNTVAGTGYFTTDQDLKLRDDLVYPPIGPVASFPGHINWNIDHFNLYLYSYIKPANKLTLTVGASGDFFKTEEKEGTRDLKRDQFNPKFGVTWNPQPGTTLRAAIFRTLKRLFITNQTLEPTQVAGFNQFFDEGNATAAWVYGAAVDQKFSGSVYGGAEFFYRDITFVPYLGQTSVDAPLMFFDTDWREYEGRAYAYWTPDRWLALSAEYLYEELDRTKEFDAGIRRMKTHSVPLGIKFFHPSGFSAGLKATYYNQEGEFIRKEILTYETGRDDFWVFDAAISYRLPKRRGFVTVGVTNLFDEKFNFADADASNPRIQPKRNIFCRVTMALP